MADLQQGSLGLIGDRPGERALWFYRGVIFALAAWTAGAMILWLLQGYWGNAATVAGLLVAIAAPYVLSWLWVRVPPEWIAAYTFHMFLMWYCGKGLDLVARIWWWDYLVHFVAGLVYTLFGFLVIAALNPRPERALAQMRPLFVAFLAFCFTAAGEAVWEIIEYALDQLFGFHMQGRPGNELHNTMWDIITLVTGAAITAVYGWVAIRRGRGHFLGRWVGHFLRTNQRFYRDRPGE